MLDVLDSPTTRFAQEAERRRIARELHDGVVQSLTALVADLEYFRTRCLPAIGQTSSEVIEKVELWQELARDSLTSMRQTLGGLRQTSGDSLTSMRQTLGGLRQTSELDLGLEYATQVILTGLRDSGYTVVFECEDWPVMLSIEYTSNIYYIIREALTNICKHARASTIKVCMFSFEEHLHISIADDGVGMPKYCVIADMESGYQQGLVGLHERATLLGGDVTVEGVAGKGTRVDVDIPVPHQHL